MRLTEIIIKRPVSAFIIIVGIVVFGVMSVMGMEQESTPQIETPMMIVSTSYSGVSPDDVDKLVTTRVEGAVGSLSGVKSVTSTSREGASMVMLEYEYGTDMDTAYIDLKERLDRVSRSLPDDAGSPSVMQMSMNSSASVSLSIHSSGKENLRYYIEEEIVPEFEKLSTVAEVSMGGGQSDYISVELMEDKLVQYGLTMSTVANSVASAGFNQPAGSVDYGSQSLSMASSVAYRSVSELENIPITISGGNLIRLADVANVFESKKDASSASRYNGEEVISLDITKRQSASAVSLSRQVRAVVDEIGASGAELTIEIMSDDSETIQDSINSVGQTLILALFISMIVLYAFFGDIRASLIVGSSMPVSLLVAFICMSFMGFTLNVITMGAMVLGVGMMVDNSIVVIDSCFKNTNKERSFSESAMEGTKFVMLSITASTITTIVVFLPLALIQGMVGQLFKPLGFTIVFALLASLFSAITLVPLFFVRFEPEEKRYAPAARFLKRVERGYSKLLRFILKKKKTVFAISLGLVVLSVFFASNLNMELMPATDEGRVQVSITTRPGTKLEKADAIVRQVEEIVAAHPDVERYNTSSGGRNSVTAYLKDGRAMSTAQIIEQWRLATKDIVDCDITVSSSSFMTSGMTSDQITVNLRGNDLDTLRDFSEEILAIFRQHPDIITATTSLESGNPQISIIVDPVKAAAYNLTPSSVATGVRQAVNGVTATTVTRDGQDYDVTVEYPPGRYETYGDVENLILVTAAGKSVPLTEVATLEFGNAAQSIRKEDNQYNVSVSGTPRSGARFTAENDINRQVNMLRLPDGVSRSASSMNRMMNEEFGSLYQAIATAVLLVFMVMTIQFESMKHSFMVMVCIPFSIIGSIALLNLTGTTLNMTSLLGFLILVGTVVNNGILFVDTANQFRQNMPVETALVSAARTRLRPILMTTLTTVLSMLPLALAFGTGAEMMQGLGIVVIGGLTASTVLTLLLLPTFYLIIDGNEEKRRRRQERKHERTTKRRAREAEKERIRREKYAHKLNGKD